jgi:hypothetical protein
MDRESIRALLKDVFGPNVRAVDHQQWVSIHCPFAEWTHAGGKDSNPSAGISVKPDGISIFNCQACHKSGPLGRMLEELGELNGEDYSAFVGGTLKDEYFGGNLKPWGQKGEERRKLPEPLDEATYLDLYDSAADHWYVAKRGLSPESAEALGLVVDPSDSEGQERILFPVYHHKGGFYGFTGRATDPNVYPPIRDYHGLPKQFLLLGSHLIPKDATYLILVEGLFDQAVLFHHGYPVVAYMGGLPTDDQIDALLDIGLPLYFFKDNDEAGRLAQEKIKETKLCTHLPVMKVRYPKRLVRGKDGKLRPLTDPDELTPLEIDRMIEDARLL